MPSPIANTARIWDICGRPLFHRYTGASAIAVKKIQLEICFTFNILFHLVNRSLFQRII